MTAAEFRHASKREKTYFHEGWETDFCFTNVNDKRVCLICGASLAGSKRGNVEQHFPEVHKNVSWDFPAGSSFCKEKVKEQETTLQKQQSLFNKPPKKATSWPSTKSPFTDGKIIKEATTAIVESLFQDHKNKIEILSAIADVQLGANTVARRVCAPSADVVR